MAPGKSRQVSFREKVDLIEEIKAAAAKEERAFADFIRQLCRIGFSAHQITGSLQALKERLDIALKAKAQVEIEKLAAKKVDDIEAPKTKHKRKAG